MATPCSDQLYDLVDRCSAVGNVGRTARTGIDLFRARHEMPAAAAATDTSMARQCSSLYVGQYIDAYVYNGRVGAQLQRVPIWLEPASRTDIRSHRADVEHCLCVLRRIIHKIEEPQDSKISKIIKSAKSQELQTCLPGYFHFLNKGDSDPALRHQRFAIKPVQQAEQRVGIAWKSIQNISPHPIGQFESAL